jgi:hypothetical protein
MARRAAGWWLVPTALLLWLLVSVGTAATGGAAAATFGLQPLGALLPPVRIAPTDRRVLLLSDEPETVPDAGILYADTVDGPFRVFLYAVDGAGRPLYFHILALAPGPKAISLEVTRTGVGGPAPVGAEAGEAAAAGYAGPRRPVNRRLAAGGRVELVPQLALTPAGPGETVAAIVDGRSSGPVQLVTAASDGPRAHPSQLLLLEPASPPGQLMRGTFPHADLTVTVPVFAWVHQVAVRAIAQPQRGWSRVDAAPVRDRGNYGVLYRICVVRYPLTWAASGRLAASAALRWGLPLALLLVPGPTSPWLEAGAPGPWTPPLRRAWRHLWRWPLRGLATQTSITHWMAVGGTNQPRVVVLPVA